MFKALADDLRAARAANESELVGQWCFRWTDSDEWTPVNGLHRTAEEASAQVCADFACDAGEFTLDSLV